MLLKSSEPISHQFSEVLKSISQNIDKFSGQLKWSFFKFQPFSRHIGQQKSEVDVQYMAEVINHNVLVMAIFYLQSITHQAVSC